MHSETGLGEIDVPDELIHYLVRHFADSSAKKLRFRAPDAEFDIKDHVALIGERDISSASLTAPSKHWSLLFRFPALHSSSSRNQPGDGQRSAKQDTSIGIFQRTFLLNVTYDLNQLGNDQSSLAVEDRDGFFQLVGKIGNRCAKSELAARNCLSTVGESLASGSASIRDALGKFNCLKAPFLIEEQNIIYRQYPYGSTYRTTPTAAKPNEIFIGNIWITVTDMGRAQFGSRQMLEATYNSIGVLSSPDLWDSAAERRRIREGVVADIAELQVASFLAHGCGFNSEAVLDSQFDYSGRIRTTLHYRGVGSASSYNTRSRPFLDELQTRLDLIQAHALEQISKFERNPNSERGNNRAESDASGSSVPSSPSLASRSSQADLEDDASQAMIEISEYQHVVFEFETMEADLAIDASGIEEPPPRTISPFSPPSPIRRDQQPFANTISQQDNQERIEMLRDLVTLRKRILSSQIIAKLKLWGDARTDRAEKATRQSRLEFGFFIQPVGGWSSLDQIIVASGSYARQDCNKETDVPVEPRFLGLGTWVKSVIVPEWRMVLAPRILRGPDVKDQEELNRLNKRSSTRWFRGYQEAEIEKTRLRALYEERVKELYAKNAEGRRDISVYRGRWDPQTHSVSDLAFMISMDLEVLTTGLEKLLQLTQMEFCHEYYQTYFYDKSVLAERTETWFQAIDAFVKATPGGLNGRDNGAMIKAAELEIMESVKSYNIRFSENMFF